MSDQNIELGDRLWLSGWAIEGKLDHCNAGRLIDEVITSINMTPAHGSSLCCYPVQGLGGVGFTVFQPITQSFVILDVWPERDVPAAYLVIGSCKYYQPSSVVEVIQSFGFKVHEASDDCLSLPTNGSANT